MSKNLYIIRYSNDRLSHSDDEESKSKYKGGFINGKNTSEYNHDYYIHNKEKWARTGKGIIENFTRWGKVAEKNLYRFLSGDQGEKSNAVLVETEVPKGMTIKTKTGGHKYKYRVTYKGKYRYFYSDAEYYSFLKNVKRKQGEYSLEDDLAAVNEEYPAEGYTRNCPSCSLAYDMRRRGYDVKSTAIANGISDEEIKKFWKNAEYKTIKGSNSNSQESAKKVTSELKSYGEGARGTVTVRWNGEGAHILNWENIGGKTYFVDAQSNQIVQDFKWERTTSSSINFEYGVNILRTDNLELSEYVADAELFKERKG